MAGQPDGWPPDGPHPGGAGGDGLYDLDDGPELCDNCAAVIYDGSEVYGLVLDSSAVDPRHPGLDGRRRLVACGSAHLAELRAYYLARPFDHDELRAHMVSRAQHAVLPEQLSLEDLTRQTGLTLAEVLSALAWRSLWYDWLPDR